MLKIGTLSMGSGQCASGAPVTATAILSSWPFQVDGLSFHSTPCGGLWPHVTITAEELTFTFCLALI
jgi:hypothetical protein